jgi:hypothetical protein
MNCTREHEQTDMHYVDYFLPADTGLVGTGLPRAPYPQSLQQMWMD